MKRLLILSVLLLGALAGRADERSTAVLQKISAALNGYKNYEMAFSFVVRQGSGASPAAAGKYIVSGEKYYIDLDQREVYCDGKAKYEVDRVNREVTIDRVNPADRTFLANPTRAFDFLDGTFTHSYEGEKPYLGRNCDAIRLHPTDPDAGLSEARLYVDRITGLPAGVVYYIDDAEVDVTVKKITPLPAVDAKVFLFDRNQYKEFELIDFR